MKKVVFLYLTLISIVFGYDYDELILKAQASIFPKIILLDKKIENKLIDNKIVYTIVYDKEDYLTALSIKEFINNNFDGRLDIYDYKIDLVDFEEFSQQTDSSAVYVLNLKNIDKIAAIATNKGIISFSYDINNLKKGLMFSLVIEKSTVLYLEKETLYTDKIQFVDALLQMVRFVDKDYAYHENMKFYNGMKLNKYYADFMNNMDIGSNLKLYNGRKNKVSFK